MERKTNAHINEAQLIIAFLITQMAYLIVWSHWKSFMDVETADVTLRTLKMGLVIYLVYMTVGLL